MAKVTISLCALLGLLLVLTSTGETKLTRPPTCCTEYTKRELPVDRITGYTVERTGRCRLDAVKFHMVSGKVVCANPAEEWAKNAMKAIRK
ncbi:hypothetical protein ACEWY4_006273 [Coilia grayii]|uniref:Chemokine interleukin-8-like domain-containing protein n=1 Tax=Coilia grayii TaxID=363190 RepID=A0ABD1KDI5_9TELE